MVKPWYKQFWPWFLILLPMTVVFWTVITVIIFSDNQVSLVTEDYYKKGKGINIDLTKINVAKEMQLNADVSNDDKYIYIELSKGTLKNYPALNVEFTHRTLADRDFSHLLTSDANGVYRLEYKNDILGPWFIKVMAHDKKWIVQGRVNFPSSSPTTLLQY
ncbi:FixH family protein [Vibrio sp.]|nr:FixH family protein [Vibrio sp.]